MPKPVDLVADAVGFLAAPGGRIAYRHWPGAGPGVLFCPGFRSDMDGAKATALAGWCRNHGRCFTAFDYRGHGRSGGSYTDFTFADWREDGLAVLQQVTSGRQIVVGSSMGGWIMVLLALARPDRVAGLVGIAAAPDFTGRLLASMDCRSRRQLFETGRLERPSRYGDDPYVFTRRLIASGQKLQVMAMRPIPVHRPVRLLHGMADADVPWRLSLDLAAAMASEDATVTLIKDGDHRLSRPADIARLLAAVGELTRADNPSR